MSEKPEGEDDTPVSIGNRIAGVLKEDEYYRILEEVTDPDELTENERYRYDRVLRNYRDLISTLVAQWEIGFAKGFVEAYAGSEEDKAKYAIPAAKYLKERGIEDGIIASSTGLSLEEIWKL
jgi:hypothetical protein